MATRDSIEKAIEKIVCDRSDGPKMVLQLFEEHIRSIGYGVLPRATDSLRNSRFVIKQALSREADVFTSAMTCYVFVMLLRCDSGFFEGIKSAFYELDKRSYRIQKFLDYCYQLGDAVLTSRFVEGNSTYIIEYIGLAVIAMWKHNVMLIDVASFPVVIKLGPPGV